MNFEEDSDEEIEEDSTFFLFFDNLKILDIYQIARNYVINEYYSLDSTILISLIKDKYLNITETLEYIPYIHSGYLSIILPTQKSSDNG